MMPAPTVDPGRVRRALVLDVQELEDGTFVVHGGGEPHHVRGRECDCPDSLYRPDRVCKHRLSVYLARQLDERVRAALREAVQ